MAQHENHRDGLPAGDAIGQAQEQTSPDTQRDAQGCSGGVSGLGEGKPGGSAHEASQRERVTFSGGASPSEEGVAAVRLPRVRQKLLAAAPLRVTLFGSSTTEGVGASSPATSYAGVFETCIRPYAPGGLTVINRGIGGQGAAEMQARLPAVLADQPDLVIWQGGVNDPLTGVPLSRFEDMTRQDLQAICATGADVALMDLQWCRLLDECPAAPAFQAAVHAMGQALHLPVFPRLARMHAWGKELGVGREDLSPDGVHMYDFGYRLLGQAVADWILTLAGIAQTRAIEP